MIMEQRVPVKHLKEEKKLIIEKKGEFRTLKDELWEELKEITPVFQKLSTSYTLIGDSRQKRKKAKHEHDEAFQAFDPLSRSTTKKIVKIQDTLYWVLQMRVEKEN